MNGLLGGSGNFRSWGLVEGSWSWGPCLWMAYVVPALPATRSASWSSWGEQFSSIMLFCMMHCLTLGLKGTRPSDKEWNFWNCDSNLFPLTWFSWVFCYSDGKLTHIHNFFWRKYLVYKETSTKTIAAFLLEKINSYQWKTDSKLVNYL
jgi:hypothetical protein